MKRAEVCVICRNRPKLNICTVASHIDGHVLTEICSTCQHLTKYLHCRNNSHSNRKLAGIDEREVQEQMCSFCNSLIKSDGCRDQRHDNGQMRLNLVSANQVRLIQFLFINC
jgi:hypothetical protein